MEIIGTKVVNGRKANVWKYTDEEKAALEERAQKAREEIEKRRAESKK